MSTTARQRAALINRRDRLARESKWLRARCRELARAIAAEAKTIAARMPKDGPEFVNTLTLYIGVAELVDVQRQATDVYVQLEKVRGSLTAKDGAS